MGNIFTWIKNHKVKTVNILLVALVLFLIFRQSTSRLIGSSYISNNSGYSMTGAVPSVENALYNKNSYTQTSYYGEAAPTPDITDRKVVLNSNFSLLVKNVSDTMDKIKKKTEQLLGYMVTSNLSKGEYSDSGTIQVRVPSGKVDEMTAYLRTLAVKVVSENVDGKDITDQYVDIDRRIADLEKQRTKMQEIMDSAKTVSEMMNVQPYLNQIQTQIDSYKGQQIYMDGVTKTSKLTISLATDEMVLPYAPKQPWKPEAVFKNAVRSMLTTLQKIGTLFIWTVVYVPLVAAIIIAFKLIRKIFRKKVQ